MARNDAALFVVAGGVARQLQDLGAEVLQDGRQVDGGAGAHAGGVLALTQVAADAAHGELQTGFGGSGGALLVAAAALSFSFARHGGCCLLMRLTERSLVLACWFGVRVI